MDRYTVPFLGVVTWLLMALAKSTEVCYCGPSCCSVPRLCGKAISPRNAFFLSGENLTLVCNVQRGSPWGLTFVRGIYAEEVPSKYIKSLNSTAIQLVIPNITDEDIRNNNASMQYKCMKEGSNGTCVDVLYVQLDYYTVTPQNVSCRIFDFNTMNCSWDLVVKYVHEEAYDVTCEVVNLNDEEVKAVFLSDITKVENFTVEKCPNQSQTSCYWDESRYPAPAVMKLKITVNNTRRNIHKDTGWITFQEYDIVEPDPVKNLRVEDTGTPGCVIIHWEPSTGCKNKNMTFRLIRSSSCSDLQEQRNVQVVNNMTVCGLVPYTNYTFSVAGHVLDPLDLDIENGHWSKWNTIYYMTQSAEIETNLTIFPGFYELSNSTSRDGQMSLKLYWNPLSKCDLHAPSDSVTYTVQWNNLTKTVYHPSFMADIFIPNLSALNVSLSTTNNVGSNAARQILQVYAYGPEPTELVLEINKTSDKCVVYTSLLVGEKGLRYTDARHTLVWCNKTELYCSAPLLWIDLTRNVTNFTFPRNQCEEQRYGLVTYSYDKGQGHTVNTGIQWEPCIYQRGKVPKKPLEDVAMSEIQPDGGFHVTWKRYDCKVSKAYIEHYTVRYCKDNGLCKCKQDTVYVNISRTSDSFTVDNLEAGTQVCVWVAGFSKSGLGPFNNLPLTITIKKKSDSVGLIVGCLLAFLVGLVAMAFVIWRIRRTYKRYLMRTVVTLRVSDSDFQNQISSKHTPLPTPDTPDEPLLDYKVPDNIDDSDNTSIDSEEPISSYGQVHYMTESTSLETDEPDVNINWNDTIPYVTYCAHPINDAANDNFISSDLGTSFQTGDTSVQNNHIQDEEMKRILEEMKRHSDAVQSQLNEMARTINAHLDTDPDLRDIIESDNLLATMWQRFRLGSINWNYVLSNGPVWITRTKLLVELTDENGKSLDRWKEIAKQITLEKGEICIDEPLRKEQEKIEIDDWDYCVEHDCQIGLVHMMRKKGFLPNSLQLSQACKRFGRKSTIIRIISQIICNSMKTSDKDIIWPAYKKENENDIIFVKIGEDQTAVHSEYNIVYWNKDRVNSENKEVISKEVESQTMIDCDEMKQIKKVINENSKRLRENHSNITMITASPFRSKGYKPQSRTHKVEKENCIVLLVPIKGIIPLQEEVFDESIGNIKTDVREGIFKWYVGGKPSEEHADLKIGCAIGPAMKNILGTLGGFVDHPEYGLCGLTCAHVLLDEEEIRSQTHIERLCVQPHCTDAVFGTLKVKVFRDSDTTAAGLDIALIKIENRLPVDGSFPDMENDDKTRAGFGENEEIRFRTGKLCHDLFKYRDHRIVKYGARTSLRRGVFAFEGTEFAICPTRYSGKPELVLKNQVQINDISNCGRFSDEGDSGALVFIVSDNNELLAAGLLLGGCDGLSVMTPIRDVLLGIGCLEPLSMTTFEDNNNYHIEQMEM